MSARVPLSQIHHRPPEAGRLRFGIKTETRNGGQRPMAIDRWRATSPDKSQIEAIAELYGGEPKPWHEPMASPADQWTVTTEAQKIAVWLPPGALNITYESWTKGGCERRCDGQTCTVTRFGGKEQVPCLCATENGQATCKPHSRLSVMLPGIPFSGVWRLDTQSENFLHEAPGMIAMIDAMQTADRIIQVELSLTKRSTRRDGKTSHFIVPTIILGQSPQEILSGQAAIGAITAGSQPLALGSGWAEPDPEIHDPVWHETAVPNTRDDDDIVDAEVIEDDQVDGWDDRSEIPSDVRVKRNFGSGKKWVRAD
jgi:hypothetical protein